MLRPASEIPDHAIQFALIRLGYLRVGTADGKIGPASQQAIRAYQRSVGDSATGTLDDRQRVGLIETAAKAGDPTSQTTLGWMAAGGVGIAKNEADARRWFKTAADLGSSDAAYNLGVLYRDGVGGSRSLSDARHYFEQALKAGNMKARSALQTLSDTP
jgi:TPR repeat protein